ncbi:hypothetical protein HK405_008017, partial [Cladochytrium tenue]
MTSLDDDTARHRFVAARAVAAAGGTDAADLALVRAVEDEGEPTYFMGNSASERKRLHMQHIIFRHLLGGLFHTPQEDLFNGTAETPDSQPATVLDVGCGPGSWAIEMAKTFPESKFVGV